MALEQHSTLDKSIFVKIKSNFEKSQKKFNNRFFCNILIEFFFIRLEKQKKMWKFIRGKGQQPVAERQILQKELFAYKKVSRI